MPAATLDPNAPIIMWFRQDLRLADNPALDAAVRAGGPVLPVYILDDDNAGSWAPGAASRWWLHQSLASLSRSLGGCLSIFRGRADEVVPELVQRTGATAVHWNRCYEPWRIARDRRIKAELRDGGIGAKSFNGSVLFEPQSVTKADGKPYRVFTPYYRKGCLENAPAPREPAPTASNIQAVTIDGTLDLDELGLMPRKNWYESLAAHWQPGEAGAATRLSHFLDTGLAGYAEGRDRPDQSFVSRLSPHLHFGEISPHAAWRAVSGSAAPADDVERFRSELAWREFSHYLLYHDPALPERNLQPRFDRFPWREDPGDLERWQRGLTGFPIVDAGMRELWATGYMHNRVRMIAGSFLVKNLLLHWCQGAAWFWDTLVDADLANNSAGWQWVAGCGTDAAPYFRIFNPVLQGRKFDPHGDYVRRFVPELAKLPDRYLHSPWEAPADVVSAAGIVPGETYPEPIVDLKASRERALQAFRSL